MSVFTQIQPPPGSVYRVALLNNIVSPKASAYHWYRNQFVRCNSRADDPHECCNAARQSWTAVALAVRYMNADKDGKLARGSAVSFSIGYVGLSHKMFEEVSALLADAPECDMYLGNHGGNYTVEGASKQPRWKDSPEASAVLAAAQEYADGEKLISKLGRKLSDREWHWFITTGSWLAPEEE